MTDTVTVCSALFLFMLTWMLALAGFAWLVT
jgi:hypothetical protein